jgi:hypothetical protein
VHDSLSLIKILETTKFDQECHLFTVDFKSLFTSIPVPHAIELMKQMTFMYQGVCSNAHFIIDLLEMTLNYNLMEFMGETFIQIFGVAMGTNIAPILANLYLAMLEKSLKETTRNDPKMIWPVLWKRFIDDGFGVKKDVEYFVHKFNSLVESIKIDKLEFGDHVRYLDLFIYKGERFFKVENLISSYIKKLKNFILIQIYVSP